MLLLLLLLRLLLSLVPLLLLLLSLRLLWYEKANNKTATSETQQLGGSKEQRHAFPVSQMTMKGSPVRSSLLQRSPAPTPTEPLLTKQMRPNTWDGK